MNIKIVGAIDEDAKQIGEIQRQTWLDSYTNPELGITKEDIETKIAEWEVKGDERIIKEMHKPGAKCWVAKDGDLVVGFVAVLKGDVSRIEALHILPAYQGQGIGTRLLETVLNWLGKTKITIEVVSYNTRAKNLYKKYGFTETDDTVEGIPLGNSKLIPKILMIRD